MPAPPARRVDGSRSRHLTWLAGSESERELISGLGGRAAVAIGGLLILVFVLPAHAGPTAWLTVAVGVFAFGAGVFLLRYPRALPVAVMDSLLVVGDVLLALLGHYASPSQPALPGIYVVIGTIVFAVREWWVSLGHAALLGTSYAIVLTTGRASDAPVARWIVVMFAICMAGLFVRWLVATVSGIAHTESASRERAESATRELRRVSQLKSAFLARMSHELRTPLNVVLGFADLLADQLVGPLTVRQQEYTRDIGDAGRHLVELVDEVLDPAKVEAGGSRLTVGAVDIRALLEDVVRMLYARAESSRLTLELDVHHDLGEIEADRLKVRQVVVNLLANALKFTPRGGRITVRAWRIADRIMISVTDTGVGIAAEDLSSVFEEFTRSDECAEGTGLGLPLARRFVELHGGALTAQSTPGVGSTFAFDLPRSVPAGGAEQEVRADAAGEDSGYAAFSDPGSAPNRALIARIASLVLLAGAALMAVLATASAEAGDEFVPFVILGAFAVVWSLVLRFRVATHSVRMVEAWAWTAIAAVSVLTYYSGAFSDLMPLAYGMVTMLSFALWPRRRALGHIAGVAVAYAAVLTARSPHDAEIRWLGVLTLFTFQGAIVSWIAERLRGLVHGEQATHRRAEQVRAELVKAAAHKSAFLANMSHELRTPLNAIIGFSDLLETGLVGAVNDRQREFLDDIRGAARHLLTIINSVLEVARLDAGQIKLDPDVIAVQGLLERAVSSAISERTDGSAPPVEIEMGPRADFVIGDHRLLELALTQLISNALKFTPSDGLVSVVAMSTPGHELQIAIRDTGLGISQSQRELIFEPFQQGTPEKGALQQGPGLGLTLARGLIELHGGSIWLSSEAEVGSTFTIVIPSLVGAPGELASAVRAQP